MGLLALIAFTPQAAAMQAANRPEIGVWTPLLTEAGPVMTGWTVRDWYDVSRRPRRPADWVVRDGILHGSGETNTQGARWVGTWLLSEHEFGDFIFEFEFSFKN